MNLTTDHDLMIAVRGGDIEKLGLLFERYHKQLYNFFLFGTKNRQVSEDLVQDIFLRILKYRHTYRDKANFMTWMYKIARNARNDYFREHSDRYEQPVEDYDLVSSDPNPEEKCERDDEINILHKALAKLPEDKQEVIIMSRFNNIRYEEIGKILGCKTGTVKVRVYRAMRELTKIYSKLTSERSYEM